ncbi:zinc ribbon domain-containing protein [Halostella sp. JP-L12]|uniref:zinc ribbon domain-containing protein n=1 Tax=Halostella TaxID=1843185 RepID=UPI000EF787AE|nr:MULTISPECIES: zinc ribbon domain-containing protein [Halostella]NHN48435.1 zinc ribbon domain-containing protein [Halostella sp. JP-L12]
MEGTDLIVLGLVVAILPFALSLFLAAGPLLWIGLGGALVVAGILTEVASETDGADRVTPTNCPGCGSPNDPDADACGHCGRSLDA